MSNRPISWRRAALFALAASVLVLCCVELAARWWEVDQLVDQDSAADTADEQLPRRSPSSPLHFQQFSDRPMLMDSEELARLSGLEWVRQDPQLGSLPDPWADKLTLTHEWLDLRGQQVLRDKPEDELRVVFLGGSALGGWGSPPGASAVGIVERLLRVAAPERKVRVLNLARTGFGSAQLAWAFEQVAPRLQPDLVVTVMGNNERLDIAAASFARQDDQQAQNRLFGEEVDASAPELQLESPWLGLLSRNSALVRLLRSSARTVHDLTAGPPALPGEAAEDEQEMPMRSKLAAPERIDRFAMQRLAGTMSTIARSAQAVGARVLVASVPVNERYNRSGHEWFFIGPERFREETYRTAHWAHYFGAPEQGAEAMRARLIEHPDELPARLLLGVFLQQLGAMEEAELELARVVDVLDEVAGRTHQGSGVEWTSETQLLYAWALKALHGPQLALEKIEPWLQSWREEGYRNLGTDRCPVANLLYYAGDPAAARVEYQACLMDIYYYRADDQINGSLLSLSRELGLESFDLAAEVRQRSPHQLPGYESFLDYCHYTPRGNLMVGHLLAGQISAVLGLPGSIEPAEVALQRFDAMRRGRLTDLPALDEWVGVNFDVTWLTSDRHGEGSGFVRQGDPDSALALVFQANELASGRYRCFGQCGCHCSLRFGPREQHDANPQAVVEAARLYGEALLRDPGLTVAAENLQLLRDRLHY